MLIKDTIKETLKLSEIVSRYIHLHKKGGESYALCPFHKEKTPSFYVNDTKNLFHCFGCGIGGDVFEFISKIENISFKDALEKLATIASIKVPTKDTQDCSDILIFRIFRLSQLWFSYQLGLEKHSLVKEYLASRLITSNEINSFYIGYAPDTGLYKFLLSKGFKRQTLLDTKLIRPNGTDYFRNRIIFPIFNKTQKIVAFGGRRINASTQPKYLNSPESDIFTKGNILYSHNSLFKVKQKEVIIVEGYTDVISLYSNGFTNTVAPLGTSITKEHLSLLVECFKKLTFCFDGDAAGKEALLRIVVKILPYIKKDTMVFFCYLDNNEDPSDIITKYGLKHFGKLLKNAKNIAEVIYELSVQGCNLSFPDQRAQAESLFLEYCDKIQDPLLKKYYIKFFHESLYKNYNRSLKQNIKFKVPCIRNDDLKLILKIVIEYPEILTTSAEHENIFLQTDFGTLSVFQNIIIDLLKTDNIDKEIISKAISNHGLTSSLEDLYKHTLSYQINTKDEALQLWKKISIKNHILCLEKEYQHEMTQVILHGKPNKKANDLLSIIKDLKQKIYM